MRSLVAFIIEHGEDTDELESFASNMGTAIRYEYPGLDIEDYGVQVDIPVSKTL